MTFVKKIRKPALGRNSIYLIILLIAIILLITSHAEIFHQPETKLLGELFKELGFAGVVAIVLVFTVEKFTRARHETAADELMDRINYNLFYAVYKRYIPEPVFAEVEKAVMRSKVFRTKHKLTYTIDDFPADVIAGANHFLCSAQTRYTLKNLTSSEIEHDVVVQLEIPILPALAPYCRVDLVEINHAPLSKEEIVAATSTSTTEVEFRHTIKIPADGVIEIHTCSYLVKDKIDSEIWASRIPSDGLTLTVSTPTKNIKVNAKANHIEKIEHTLKNSATNTWELDHGIFPYQSIVFWWK